MATRKTAASKSNMTATAKASKPDNSRWKDVQMPEGFKAVTNGDMGEEWDYENDPIIVGGVEGEVRELQVGKGRDVRDARVMSVRDENDGRLYNVWESASLVTFFDTVAEGDRVSVAFQGYRDVGKASPMKVFLGAVEDNGQYDEPAERKPAKKTASKSRRR